MFGRIALVLLVLIAVALLWPYIRDLGERGAHRRRQLEEALEASRRQAFEDAKPVPEKPFTVTGSTEGKGDGGA